MEKKLSLILVLIAAITLTLAACRSGMAEQPDQGVNQPPLIPAATETPVPTELPPTETPVPPTETPAPPPTEAPATGIKPGDSVRTVMVGDLERSYILHIPKGMTGEDPVTVVFAFHGLITDHEWMLENSGFNTVSDRLKSKRSRFLVVYPEGEGNSWNIGDVDVGYASISGLDDVAFVQEILSDLETMFDLDHNRIYAAGKSMGGMLSYRLACDMSDTFAAVASVGGPMMYNACAPTRAVPVLHIHGLSDTVVQFSGGGDFETPPVEESITTWAALNSCTESEIKEGDGSGVEKVIHSNCQDGAAVELYKIAGLDHVWPDMASKSIWMFFNTHPMP